MTLGERDLFYYYKINALLTRQNAYTLTEIENMLPFERNVYIDLLSELIEKENQEKERIKNRMTNG